LRDFGAEDDRTDTHRLVLAVAGDAGVSVAGSGSGGLDVRCWASFCRLRSQRATERLRQASRVDVTTRKRSRAFTLDRQRKRVAAEDRADGPSTVGRASEDSRRRK